VRSKTKFWQMVGRGTRLCPNLFDYCQNLEYFSQDIPGTEGNVAESLAKRLFNARLELIAVLDKRRKKGTPQVAEPTQAYEDPKTDGEVRQAVAQLLQRQLSAMNLDNFLVRPHRRLVEKYSQPEA